MAVTLKEIAKEAGVSQMTVSRILNGRSDGQVSREVAERVKVIAARLDYRPNRAARSLRTGFGERNSAGQSRVITVLIPYPSFLEDLSRNRSEEFLCLLNELMQTGSEHDIRLETVPVSRLNDALSIEWRWLEHLQSGSKVVAISTWFIPVLMELTRRGCHIAMISGEVFWRSVCERYTRDWALFTYMTADGGRQLTDYLFARGFRKPAIASSYLHEPEEPLTRGYLQSLADHRCTEENLICLKDQNAEQIREQLAEAWRQHPFDSLVFDAPTSMHFDERRSMNENLGLTDQILVVQKYDAENCLRLQPQVTAMQYPHARMVKDIVDALAEELFKPGERFYRGILVDRRTSDATENI